MMGVDPRRFGPYAARGYLRAKNEETYRSVLQLIIPMRSAPMQGR